MAAGSRNGCNKLDPADKPRDVGIKNNDPEYQKEIRELLHHNTFRVYLREDLIGVQICGAIKNVLAIGCGISDGLGYGANAKALITRGLAEMERLGLALGARAETFLGLAGKHWGNLKAFRCIAVI